MIKKPMLALCSVIFILLASQTGFGQARIPEYPSRVASGQNYSYYRYHRRVISNPVSSVPYRQPVFNRSSYSYQPAAYRDPAPYVQNQAQPNAQVFEEEIREEFRTWPSRLDAGEPAAAGLEALESEIADLRIEVRNLSRKIDLSLSEAQKRQESGIRTGDAEKMGRLKQELRELKALLEQLRKEK